MTDRPPTHFPNRDVSRHRRQDAAKTGWSWTQVILIVPFVAAMLLQSAISERLRLFIQGLFSRECLQTTRPSADCAAAGYWLVSNIALGIQLGIDLLFLVLTLQSFVLRRRRKFDLNDADQRAAARDVVFLARVAQVIALVMAAICLVSSVTAIVTMLVKL